MPVAKPQSRSARPILARLAAWRPGIAWHLGIAFLAVSGLAAVANFALQRTVSITTTQLVAPAPVRAPARGPLRPAAPAAPQAADGKAALPALERLSATTLAMRQMPADERQARLRAAADEVRATLVRLHGSSDRADAVLRTAVRLVQMEAARDEAHARYAATVARIEESVQATVDRSWRILGRVVARQSLVVANQNAEELRRASEVLRGTGYSPAEMARLAEAERQFAAALAAAERNFTRANGAEWFTQTTAEVAQLQAARPAIVDLDAQRRRLLPRFQVELALARTQLETPVVPRGAVPVSVSAPEGRSGAPSARPDVAPDAQPDVPAWLAPPRWTMAPRVTTRNEAVEDGLAPSGFAWLSGGVLLLLLGVSMLTVLSILRPVQRLIAASQRIALGEGGVRVPRGGTRELDRLGAAFNRMAEELETAHAMARNYQQQLESRVAERTRQLQHQAGHDALTQLPNRRRFLEHLRGVLSRSGPGRLQTGLFFIDLDNFKTINDGRGHAYGDRVLVAVAERLSLAAGGTGLAARFGGDEFTIVVEGATGPSQLLQFGNALVRAFEQPLQLDGRDLLVSASVGAAFHPQHGSDAESLLRAADAALFQAKAQGRSQLALFTPELLEQATARFTMEQALRHAIERGELELVFQPEIDIAALEVTVCEALLRWRRPDGQLVSPEEFLAVAAESGLILQIDDWVLQAAVAAAARWRRGANADLRVAINASSRQLADPAFAERVGALLEEHGLPASALEIELTESVLQTGAGTIAGLRRLLHMGVTVALDDFGTGYSSLASLEQLPLSRVKLDRSLIASIDESDRARSIASAIIKLCRDLRVQVTAEGVERPAQLAMLRDSGVTVQGFLISRPVDEAGLPAAVRAIPALLESFLLQQSATGGDLPALDTRTGLHRRLRAVGGESQ